MSLPNHLVNNQKYAKGTFVPFVTNRSNGVGIVLAMNALVVSACPFPVDITERKQLTPICRYARDALPM